MEVRSTTFTEWVNDCNDLDNAWQLVTKFQIKPALEVFQVQQIS